MATGVVWLTDFAAGGTVQTSKNIDRLEEPMYFLLCLKKWKIFLPEKIFSNIEAKNTDIRCRSGRSFWDLYSFL